MRLLKILTLIYVGIATTPGHAEPDQPSTIKQGVDTSFVPTRLKQFGYT